MFAISCIAALVCRPMQPCTISRTIVSMHKEDADAIDDLESYCVSSGWTEEQYRGLLEETDSVRREERIPPWALWGIRCGCHVLAGYISLGVYSASGELELFNLAVRQAHRRGGAARALLLHALAWGKANGFETMFLEVRQHNAPALALYESAGFAPVGRRKAYYQDTGEDAIVMACPLGDRNSPRSPDSQPGGTQ